MIKHKGGPLSHLRRHPLLLRVRLKHFREEGQRVLLFQGSVLAVTVGRISMVVEKVAFAYSTASPIGPGTSPP